MGVTLPTKRPLRQWGIHSDEVRGACVIFSISFGKVESKSENETTGFQWPLFIALRVIIIQDIRSAPPPAAISCFHFQSQLLLARSSERVSKWTAAAGSAVHHAVFSPLQHMAELRGGEGGEGPRERHAKFSPMLD